ncbi:hypothetical protein KAF25_009397 [Fusarium avenaceum]|uniref:Uncharacterized protein n=1 Tax=Fusarium avenaceum TaxID=40199 RepID=A0A9P7HHV7_9HYPO|nr:hypothetical protein KAF25_009397 [Fusarium avenaceum]
MTMPSQFHMPGGFNREGVHPGLFRPPMSPSASSYGYPSPYSTATPDGQAMKRKRRGHEMSRSQDIRIPDDFNRQGYFGTPLAQMRHGDRHYQLAGQLDTPSAGPFDNGNLDESMYSDSDYRRALGSKRTLDDIDRNDAGPTQLFNLPPQPMPSQGWGSFAVSTLGGVVGRVWEFCKTGSFRGFQAGGGRAFAMNGGKVEELDQTLFESQHLPGRFPASQEDYFNHQSDNADQGHNSGASTPTAPCPKRRHTDNRDELGRNWVMVSDEKPAEPEPEARPTPPPRQPSYRPSPRSRNSGPSMATGRRISAAPSTRAPSSRAPTTRYSSASTPSQRRSTVNRPSSRLSVGPSPSGPSPRAASTASFASLASLGSPREATPSKIPQPSRRRNTTVSSPIAKTSSHRRSHSNASVASGRTTAEESPRLTTEAKHLAARRKMEERDADVRINAFNKQLQDMIRQGREALGTTIEVEGNWDDDL